jgi:uncharacterized membrane protein YoaK (UPF0700 family)
MEREELQQRRRLPERLTWVVFAAAFVAGAVDAIGFLLLAHVFTSHMSGNSVKLTVAIAAGDWGRAAISAGAIVAFVAGAIFGLLALEAAALRGIARTFAAVAGVELILLVVFAVLAHPPAEWTLALPAAAMGVQNALLRCVGGKGVRTTVITGMLVHFANAIVLRSQKEIALYGMIWISFVAGGIAGACLDNAYGPVALALPILGLFLLICADLVRPLTQPG